jgi:hypothetical protein
MYENFSKTYKPSSLHTAKLSTPFRRIEEYHLWDLRRYWLQNTKVTDFIEITQQFAERLSARGYDRNTIIEVFSAAANKLDNKTRNTKEKRATDDTIYLHWTWHPRDISKPQLRAIFNGVLKEKSGFNNLIIAYSRPKNLRDCLMKTQISEPEGHRVSSFLPHY